MAQPVVLVARVSMELSSHLPSTNLLMLFVSEASHSSGPSHFRDYCRLILLQIDVPSLYFLISIVDQSHRDNCKTTDTLHEFWIHSCNFTRHACLYLQGRWGEGLMGCIVTMFVLLIILTHVHKTWCTVQLYPNAEFCWLIHIWIDKYSSLKIIL